MDRLILTHKSAWHVSRMSLNQRRWSIVSWFWLAEMPKDMNLIIETDLRVLQLACEQQPEVDGKTPVQLNFTLFSDKVLKAPESTESTATGPIASTNSTDTNPATTVTVTPSSVPSPVPENATDNSSLRLGLGLGIGLALPLNIITVALTWFLTRRSCGQIQERGPETDDTFQLPLTTENASQAERSDQRRQLDGDGSIGPELLGTRIAHEMVG